MAIYRGRFSKETSRFTEGEAAIATKFPTIVFASDHNGMQFRKWAGAVVNNKFSGQYVARRSGRRLLGQQRTGILRASFCEKNIIKGSVTEALWLVLLALKKANEKFGNYSQYEGEGRGI